MDDNAIANPMTYSAERRYMPNVRAPRRARRFVGDFLLLVDGADLRENADLIISEIVSDAVRQSPSQISLRVTFDRRVLRVEVSDDPGLVAYPSKEAFERHTGRQLVDALASRWGSDADRDRTTTWFELKSKRIRSAA